MLKITPIEQKRGYTCGPTCIAMLAAFYGRRLSWARIMSACRIDRDGMTNKDLVEALQKLGFKVTAKSRNSWADLERNYRKSYPTVIAWMLHGYEGHFSVVVEVKEKYLILADPDNGRMRRISKNVFMRLWFDYDELYFPRRAKDINLRWAATITGLK